MSAIPEDVWSAACAHFDTMEKSQEIPMLCRAILAERERCARIAEAHHSYPIVRRDPDDVGGFSETVVGLGGIGPAIAFRIRTPTEQPNVVLP